MLIRPKYLVVLVMMLFSSVAMAAAKNSDDQPKEISGMSIIGDKETPKSLVIVPWKSSQIGKEQKMSSDLLNEDLKPVDKRVFMRELDFYKVSVGK